MNISLKPASRGLTVVASLLCLGGVLSFVKSDERMKPLALNIILTTGAVAVGSQLSGKWYEDIANSQLADITSKHANELKNLTSLRDEQRINYQKQSSVLAEVKALSDKQDVEIKARDAAISLLQNKLSFLTLEFEQKTQELDGKLAVEDTRFDDLKQEFKQQVISNLSEKLYQVFNSLSDSITFQLEKIKTELSEGEYSEKHDKLSVLFSSLDDYYQSHCSLLKDISDIDGSICEIVVEVIAIYSRMTDEQSSLKVRYRNLLNVDERRALEDAYTTLADINKTHTPITKAKDLLGEYSAFQKNQLNNLGEKLEDNVNSLSEMRGQVFDLIAQIEQGNLKIAELNNQIVELKKPQQFYGKAVAAQAGNDISKHFYNDGKSGGFKLDCLDWEETISGYTITFGIRKNPGITEDDIFSGNHREQIAAYGSALKGTLPTVEFNRQKCVMVLIIQLRPVPTKVITPQEMVQEIRSQLRPSNALIDFVNQAFHVGMWGETGKGKTTAISNTIGGMIQGLGAPTIRTTIPKMDADSAKMFPTCDWLGVPNSIFGMLEAALEIQYRIWVNEQAYLKGEEVKDFEPILFFIDEINLIFMRWRKVVDADMDDVLERFSATLSGERKEYFDNHMRLELRNYKNEFAKRLLMFIWQTGRSLRVKSLIAGQNLQPGALGLMTNDLLNCAYIAFGDSKAKCAEYKVKSSDLATINEQLKLVEIAQKTDPNLQYTGLFCPSVGSSFLSVLPASNTYQWSLEQFGQNRRKNEPLSAPDTIRSKVSTGLDGFGQKTSDSLDIEQKNVQPCPTVDGIPSKTWTRFGRLDNLSKQYQNLGFEGLVQLWTELPKKSDGTVHKTQAYERVFKVSRSEERKIYSEFIDYLEALCK
jgi:hypothetical protein